MQRPKTQRADNLIDAAGSLRDAVASLSFAQPTAYVYNPLVYAWRPHRAYLATWGTAPKRVVFLGMNPGPWGMAQVGVPFGEVSMVRDWIGIRAPVDRPRNEHSRRPVQGFDCPRSEVSGRRLWGLFAERFGTADAFFAEHFVANYCPLMFMEAGGRNRTPNKLPAAERRALGDACDAHLREIVRVLKPSWVVGVGAYAAKQAESALQTSEVGIARILHPSPASPAANRDWSGQATRELVGQGIWGNAEMLKCWNACERQRPTRVSVDR